MHSRYDLQVLTLVLIFLMAVDVYAKRTTSNSCQKIFFPLKKEIFIQKIIFEDPIPGKCYLNIFRLAHFLQKNRPDINLKTVKVLYVSQAAGFSNFHVVLVHNGYVLDPSNISQYQTGPIIIMKINEYFATYGQNRDSIGITIPALDYLRDYPNQSYYAYYKLLIHDEWIPGGKPPSRPKPLTDIIKDLGG